MIKSQLRKIFLTKQLALSATDRAINSQRIAHNFFASFDLAHVNFLHCFIPIEKFNEIDTAFIFHGVWKRFPQIQTVVPRVHFQSGEIESVRYTAETELQPNQWSIREPLNDELVEANKIDMVLTPGLAFDRSGHRVGYGKGFYDRFLRQCRPACPKVGLSYFDPVDTVDDSHDGDIRLDHVVTPGRALKLRIENGDLG